MMLLEMKVNDLDGEKRKRLRDAIVESYPDREDLRMMIDLELEKNLNAIAGGNNNEQIVFNLIQKANNEGWITELIGVLADERPQNQEIKAIKQELGIISRKEWKQLDSILSQIIDLNIITDVCRTTLVSIKHNQDVFGNYPESINIKEVDQLREIFLEKCPKNNLGKPTILEFVERLIEETNEIPKEISKKLNCWLKQIAKSLNIELPTYQKKTSEAQSSETNQVYLLVTITSKGDNQVYLEAELEGNCLKNGPLKLELNQEKPKVECSFDEIIDRIDKFIHVSKKDYLNKYIPYLLTIELFLPLQYLGRSIDLKKISIGFDMTKPIGSEYNFVVRSLDRLLENDREYLNRLSLRWKHLEKFLKTEPKEDEIKNNFEHLDRVDNCNWEKLVNNLEFQQRVGLKLTCCLPESDEKKKELFIAILKGGVPLVLWTRSNKIAKVEVERQFDRLLTFTSLQDLNTLFKLVRQLRAKAHAEGEKAKDYLGYHLGFLCDDPNRLPFHLMEENQSFYELGK